MLCQPVKVRDQLSTSPTQTNIAVSSASLESGQLFSLRNCPFFSVKPAEIAALQEPLQIHSGSKDISFDPIGQRFSGRKIPDDSDTAAIQNVLNRFSESARRWLDETFPEYVGGLTPDRVTWHWMEEATRQLRHNARNDLLHIDNFPTRPTLGRRILRVFVNLNAIDPQVWATSDKFPEILRRFSEINHVPSLSQSEWMRVGSQWMSLFKPGWRGRSDYDRLMMRIHDFLKNDNDFQLRASRKIWSFTPGSMWMAYTDSLSHAWLRGCYTLEHSFFVSPHVLQEPDEAPLARLSRPKTSRLMSLAG